jgi:hypothetical protein
MNYTQSSPSKRAGKDSLADARGGRDGLCGNTLFVG